MTEPPSNRRRVVRRTIEVVVRYLNGGEVPEVVPVPVGIVDREVLQRHSGRPPAVPQQPH